MDDGDVIARRRRSIDAVDRSAFGWVTGSGGRRFRGVEQRGQCLVVGQDEGGRLRCLVQRRHLSERQILGKAPRRELLARAGQDGEKGAACRVGTARAAIEKGGHAGAREGVLEQRDVAVGRAQEHGHLVEPHAGARLLQNPPRDLDALAAFTRRGVEGDVAARRALRRLTCGKQAAPQRDQIAVAVLFEHLRLDADRLQPFQRGNVAKRHGDQHVGRAGDQRAHECELDGRIERHVEQDDRRVLGGSRIERGGRGLEQRGAVDGRRGRELFLEAVQQLCEIAAAERQRHEAVGRDVRETDLLQRARERTRKAGHRGDRTEIRQRVIPGRVERRPGRDRLRREVRGGGELPVGEHGRSQPRSQLREAESVQPDRGAGADGDVTREIVGGTARRRDDQHVALPRVRVDEPARLGQAQSCGGRFDQADHAVPPGRRAGSP